MRSLQSHSSPHSFSPSLRKRSTSPSSPSDLRTLKTKVSQLLAANYLRCRSCVKKRAVHPQIKDFAAFLEEHLKREEFEAIVDNPPLYIQDPQLCKALVVEEEPSWDYLLAHDPDEITPLHLFYKKRNEEKVLRIKKQREELERKRREKTGRQSLPSTSKPQYRVHPATLFEQPPVFASRPVPNPLDNLVLPHIASVPLLLSSQKQKLPRSNAKTILWKEFHETYLQAEDRYRQKVAKSQPKQMPRLEKANQSAYGERELFRKRRNTRKISRLQRLL